MRSLIQTEKECFICKTTQNLHLHHIFFGKNRKLSDKDGCVCYLCQDHHTGQNGVHHNQELDLTLKRVCEEAWIKSNNSNIRGFINRFGKNYLENK